MCAKVQKNGKLFPPLHSRQGDLRDADQLYRDFMGRDPDPEALLKCEHL